MKKLRLNKAQHLHKQNEEAQTPVISSVISNVISLVITHVISPVMSHVIQQIEEDDTSVM